MDRRLVLGAGDEQAPAEIADDPTWTIREITGGHDSPIEVPDKLTAMLIDAIP